MTLRVVLGLRQLNRTAARSLRVGQCFALVAMLLAGTHISAHAQKAAPEEDLKAAFLYQFAQFIQWPPKRFDSPNAPLVVGVIGRGHFADILRQDLDHKFVGSHEVVIREYVSAREARECHILYIDEDPVTTKLLIDELGDAEVLTVCNGIGSKQFAGVGAVVNLVNIEKHIRFEINVDAARRAELKINSSLLNLAKIVRDGRA
jgi:hypothetical protein